jgi:hypothetical protein
MMGHFCLEAALQTLLNPSTCVHAPHVVLRLSRTAQLTTETHKNRGICAANSDVRGLRHIAHIMRVKCAKDSTYSQSLQPRGWP